MPLPALAAAATLTLAAALVGTGERGSSSRRRPSSVRTILDFGFPLVWFHGTSSSFSGRLKPNKGMGGACVWLADRDGALAYAGRSGGRIVEVALSPTTRLVDLSDPDDPIVREFIRRDRLHSNIFWHGRSDVTDLEMVDAVAAWRDRTTDYDVIESRSWSGKYFRSAGVDALLVRDVLGWGGAAPMTSICLLNRSKIEYQK